MRQLVLSPRWILWHLLTLGAMATCGWLAVWQWERAGSALGSAINVGYGLQWPVFAIFFGVMWWRMLRLELQETQATEAGAEVASDGGPDPSAQAPVAPAAAPPTAGPPAAADASPFTPRPRSAPPVTDEEDPELAAYNRMLAHLAARDGDER